MARSLRRQHLRLLALSVGALAVMGTSAGLLVASYLSDLAARGPAANLFGAERWLYLLAAIAAALFLPVLQARWQADIAIHLREDLRSLLRLFRDVRQGTVRPSYPMALEEFSEAFEHMRNHGRKLVAEKARLTEAGLIDHLSQLGNRRDFEARLQELFEALRSHGPSSLLLIDVDRFKQVNDRHGHDAGDALITGFSSALRTSVRGTDILARLGGDEFCVVYPYANLAQARVFAERLRRELPRELALTRGIRHELRWTGGLSVMSDKDTKPEDVLWRADQALLRAKEAGRNRTMSFDPETGLLEAPRGIMPS